MNWDLIFASILMITLMTLYQWPKLKQNQKREKAAFLSLTILGLLIAIVLITFPDLPGPTQMIDWLYKPLGRFLEKGEA